MLRAELLQSETPHTFLENFKEHPGCLRTGNQISRTITVASWLGVARWMRSSHWKAPPQQPPSRPSPPFKAILDGRQVCQLPLRGEEGVSGLQNSHLVHMGCFQWEGKRGEIEVRFGREMETNVSEDSRLLEGHVWRCDEKQNKNTGGPFGNKTPQPEACALETCRRRAGHILGNPGEG